MRVLMVISQFYPMIGGAEKQAQLLATKLMERGVSVDIVTGWWKFGTARKERIDGIQVFRNFACWGMLGIKGIRTLGALIYMMSLSLFLLLHKRRYDLIHVHQALYPAFVSVLVGKRILRKPVLVKTASSGKTSDIEGLKKFPLGKFQLKWLLKEMEWLVVVSKMSGKDFEKVGYPKNRMINIPNGVEILAGTKSSYDQAGCVLTIARFSREKGVDILIQALAKVFAEEKHVRLLVLGSGPMIGEMENMVRSLNMKQSVEFVGFVNEVEEYLRKADLFILPSRTEGMSNALLEAMSYGIPCIATNVGGNGELMGGEGKEIRSGEFVTAKNGLLVNADDVNGLSEAILYLLRHPEQREELGRKGRAFIRENYSIDLIADRYIRLYQSMLNKRI